MLKLEHGLYMVHTWDKLVQHIPLKEAPFNVAVDS